MTHTLHREGELADLERDIIVLAIPCRGITTDGSGPKLRRFFQLARKHNPVNMGNSKHGNQYTVGSQQALIDGVQDGGVCHAVYTDLESVRRLLVDLKNEDLGLSVTVSGLMDAVNECCRDVGLRRHSVNMSLGIFGRLDKLAEGEVRELTTMCGHGMVTADLVLEVTEKVRTGKITPEKAAERLAKTCLCGVFNPERGARLLTKMAKGRERKA